MRYYVAFTLAGLTATILAIWQWGINAPALSYGNPAKTYFKPAIASPGDNIEICFDDITWYRICPSALTTYLQPASGHRKDFTTYNISTPLNVGKVPPKCRPFVVPEVEAYGVATLYGHARHFCKFWEVDTKLPEVKLNIVQRNILKTPIDNMSSSTTK